MMKQTRAAARAADDDPESPNYLPLPPPTAGELFGSIARALAFFLVLALALATFGQEEERAAGTTQGDAVAGLCDRGPC
jgi:hypothetical protein